MQNMDFSKGGMEGIVITLIVMGFVCYRMLGERRMSLGRLLIFPLIMLALVGVSLWTTVSHSWVAALLALAGLLAGWGVGELTMRTQTVRLDPTRPNLVIVKGSVLTVVIFMASFLLRAGVSVLIGQHALHGVLGDLSGALLAFGIALIVMRNYGVYRAALRLRARGQVAHG